MLKRLSEFRTFDWHRFAKDKVFVTTGQRPWQEYANGAPTGKRLGTSVEVVILHDHTQYRSREGEQVSNRFEKLVFKVPDEVDIALNVEVVPIEVIATVYGEFQNQLSIKCSRVELVKKA